MTLSAHKVRELRQSDATSTGNRIAKALELAGVSQTEAARAIGIPYTYVSDVARGRFKTITVENAHKFASYFGCDIEDLFPAREAVAS